MHHGPCITRYSHAQTDSKSSLYFDLGLFSQPRLPFSRLRGSAAAFSQIAHPAIPQRCVLETCYNTQYSVQSIHSRESLYTRRVRS